MVYLRNISSKTRTFSSTRTKNWNLENIKIEENERKKKKKNNRDGVVLRRAKLSFLRVDGFFFPLPLAERGYKGAGQSRSFSAAQVVGVRVVQPLDGDVRG